MDERFRAVDRIDDPAKAAGAGPVGQFFAQNRVLGKVFRDPLAKMLFGLPVGLGDRRVVALSLHQQTGAAKELQGDPPGLAGGRKGQLQPAARLGSRKRGLFMSAASSVR